MDSNEVLLTSQSFGMTLSSEVLWIIFIVALLFFAGLSAVLLYHWKKYEVSTTHVVVFTSTYFFVTGALLLTMLLALLAYAR